MPAFLDNDKYDSDNQSKLSENIYETIDNVIEVSNNEPASHGTKLNPKFTRTNNNLPINKSEQSTFWKYKTRDVKKYQIDDFQAQQVADDGYEEIGNGFVANKLKVFQPDDANIDFRASDVSLNSNNNKTITKRSNESNQKANVDSKSYYEVLNGADESERPNVLSSSSISLPHEHFKTCYSIQVATKDHQDENCLDSMLAKSENQNPTTSGSIDSRLASSEKSKTLTKQTKSRKDFTEALNSARQRLEVVSTLMSDIFMY